MKAFDRVRNWKLRKKLILSCLLLTIIPIVSLSGYSYQTARSRQESEAKRGLEETVRQIAVSTNEQIENYNTAMRFITANRRVQQILSRKTSSSYDLYSNLINVLDPMMDTLRMLFTDIRSIRIYNSAGLRSLRTYALLPLEDALDEPWYERSQTAPVLSWQVENDLLMCVGKVGQIYHTDVNSIVCFFLPLQKVFASDIRTINEYDRTVLDAQGEAVYSSENVKPSVLGSVPSGEKTGEITLDGKRYYLIRQEIPGCGWTLQYLFAMDEIKADMRSIILAGALLIGGCVLCICLLALLLTHKLVRPIESLNEQMQLVRSGQMNITARSDTNDDIGQLTNCFGDMLDYINHLIEDQYKNQIIRQNAEFKALQAQINPHFLYNTLSSINWMAIRCGSPEISKVINSLSKFYRATLNNGYGITRVREELENIQCYLDIQLILHDSSFDAMLDVEEEIMECPMIHLILQPIVENAIEHGVDLLESERGAILIRGRRQGERLVFTVSDNGPGMSEEAFQTAISVNHKSYGLSNVQRRIQTTYGERYGLELQATDYAGATVIVDIPDHVEEIDINLENHIYQ